VKAARACLEQGEASLSLLTCCGPWGDGCAPVCLSVAHLVFLQLEAAV